MDPRRSVNVTSALCGTFLLAGGIVVGLAGFGSAGIENAAGALPVEDRRAVPLATGAERADAPQSTAVGHVAVASADAAAVTELATETVTGATAAPAEPAAIGEAALPDPSQMAPPETPPVQIAMATTSDLPPSEVKGTVSTVEILDECLVIDICVDQYLWTLYQRTPKEDTMKVHEQRKVTVKRKRKMVTVTRTFTKLVPQNFTWKDPDAAKKAGMPMIDYVIGGMDRSFKLKLFHTLRAAELAGLSPGITSAFRDDYRQSIASGLKAASDRSFHGGSFRGGYGHGLAADVVSVKGATKTERWASTESLWKWIDTRGKEFGIGRPYLDRDPPHVAPIDGKEYSSRRGPKTQTAESAAKKPKRLAVRNDRSPKQTRSAQRSKANMRVAAQVRR
jgi:hypothetical protein